MSIQFEDSVLDTLTSAGQNNNPILAWNNFCQGAGATMSSSGGTEAADGSAANAVTGTTYDYWVVDATSTAVTLEATFNTSRAPTFAGIAGHNIADLGGTLRVQRSDNGSTWEDVGTGAVTPTTNEAVGFYFDPGSATKYWRLRVANIASGQQVQVGVFFLGKAVVIPTRVYQGITPPIRPNAVTLSSNISEGGHFLGSTVVNRGIGSTFPLSHVSPEFIRGTDNSEGFASFIDHFNRGNPFWFAWRPEKYGDLFWCIRKGAELSPTNTGPGELMGFDLNLRGFWSE